MPTRGIVTLVFDDGYEVVYQNVLPLLRQYKMPAVFAIPLEATKLAAETKQKIRPWREWLSLRSARHEIAAHSVTHADLTQLLPAQLMSELKEPAEQLAATTLIYPGGAHNEQVIAEAKKYYQAARTARRGFEQLPPADAMRLRSYNFTRRNFSVWKANLLALWAWITNCWLIETYHIIDDTLPPAPYCIRTRDLAQHLQFLSQLPVRVQTIEKTISSV